jgi:hypothetical protein
MVTAIRKLACATQLPDSIRHQQFYLASGISDFRDSPTRQSVTGHGRCRCGLRIRAAVDRVLLQSDQRVTRWQRLWIGNPPKFLVVATNGYQPDRVSARRWRDFRSQAWQSDRFGHVVDGAD